MTFFCWCEEVQQCVFCVLSTKKLVRSTQMFLFSCQSSFRYNHYVSFCLSSPFGIFSGKLKAKDAVNMSHKDTPSGPRTFCFLFCLPSLRAVCCQHNCACSSLFITNQQSFLFKFVLLFNLLFLNVWLKGNWKQFWCGFVIWNLWNLKIYILFEILYGFAKYVYLIGFPSTASSFHDEI